MNDRLDALHEKQRQAERQPDRSGTATARKWALLMLAVILAASILLRARLLAVPLERDEGEYAYTGQLILQGIPPYEQAYTMKMPGVHAAYALIMAVFGQTDKGIRTGLIVVNAATVVILFMICMKLLDGFAAVVAAAAFALLSFDRWVHGFVANAEHFVMLPALAGILLLLYAIERPGRVVLAAGSFLLGTAFLMKQHAALFILFAGFFLLISELKRRPLTPKLVAARCLLFAGSAALPFALTCLILLSAGVFENFWFWTFTYTRQYTSAVPVTIGWQGFTKVADIVGSSPLVWALAGVGVVAIFADRSRRRHRLFVISLAVFSFLSVCPGLYFRPHYFLLVMPAVALLAGLGAASLARMLRRRASSVPTRIAPVLIVLLAFGHTLYGQRNFLFTIEPNELSRLTFGPNPFPESIPIARFIRENSDPGDTIAILGSEPQIPFYARRRSATAFMYTYPVVEPNPASSRLQREMIEQIEASRPKIIVLVSINMSWGAGSPPGENPIEWMQQNVSDTTLLDWMPHYINEYYDKAGDIKIISPTYTDYSWRPQTHTYPPECEHEIIVFMRKNSS